MKDEQGSQLEATNAVPTSRRRHWMVGIALAIPALPVLAVLVLYLLNPAGTRMLVGGLHRLRTLSRRRCLRIN
jgi:hypothetical protein